MHEYGLAAELISAVDRSVKSHHGVRATRVVVASALLDAVEQDSLRTAFDACKGGTVAQDADLVIRPIPVTVGCLRCGLPTTVAEVSGFICPACGATAAKTISAPEVYVATVDIEM